MFLQIALDMRIPPLRIKIMLESNPMKSRMLVQRLAIMGHLGVSGVSFANAA